MQILIQKLRERANLKLCLQQRTQEYVWVSYSNGLNFALLFFFPVIFFFLSLEVLFTEEEALMLLIHILQLSTDLGMETIYSFKNPLSPGLDDTGVWRQSPVRVLCWLMAHAQHCAWVLPHIQSPEPVQSHIYTCQPMRVGTSTPSQFFSYLFLNKLWKLLPSPLNFSFFGTRSMLLALVVKEPWLDLLPSLTLTCCSRIQWLNTALQTKLLYL